MAPYISCRCHVCRHMSSPADKKWHKQYGHRVFRRQARQHLRFSPLYEDEDEQIFLEWQLPDDPEDWPTDTYAESDGHLSWSYGDLPDRISTGYLM